jgi:AcrR family transcriptional regulator
MGRVRTENKRLEILEAASRVFAERPFHEVLIEDVAATARVGKGTIYRYFETKDDLYFSTILHGFDTLSEGLEKSLASEASPVARLERIAHEVIAYFSVRQYLATLLQNERRFERRDGELKKRRDVVHRLVTECLLEGIERRELRGVDVRIAAELFRGMVRAAVWLDPADDPRDLAKLIVEIFVLGTEKRG